MRVYLDHQAATPILPEAREAMEPFLRRDFGNPGSLHAEGIRVRDALSQARERLAIFLGARTPEEIVFTGNGTEAVNLAIKGVAWASRPRGNHIVLSAAEHPAVTESVRWLLKHGFESTTVGVDSEGRILTEAVRDALRPETTLVCIHHSNHDIGTVQPVSKIAPVVRERGIPLFVDARSSAGWLPCNASELGASLMAVSPSRFYGPKGVGVLYRSRPVQLHSLVHGGDQEDGLRAGLENIAGIVGAGVAAEVAGQQLAGRQAHVLSLQKKALDLMRKTVEGFKLLGPDPGGERHPGHLSFALEQVEGEALGLMLDVRGIAVATGSACVSRDKRVPPVLAAIGLPERWARGNVILSFGKDNTSAEVDFFAETLAKVVPVLREMSLEHNDY